MIKTDEGITFATTLPKVERGRIKSRELNRTLDEAVDEFIAENPITKGFTADRFSCDVRLITESDRRFFEVYSRIALKQLFWAALRKPSGHGLWNRTPLHALLSYKKHGLSYTPLDSNQLFFHDIGHSIIALLRSKNKKDIESLTPDFLTRSNAGRSNIHSEREEVLTSFMDVPRYANQGKREVILEWIKWDSLEEFMKAPTWLFVHGPVYPTSNAKSSEEKLRRDRERMNKIIGTRKDNKWFWEVCEGIYNEYEGNPRYIFELFKEVATPLMKKYAKRDIR